MEETLNKKLQSPGRYDKSHPTVSARVPVETRDKLYAVLKRRGMSLADALRILADELEVKGMPIDEARGKGFEDAMNLYAVTYRCYVCGKPIAITSRETKQFLSEFLTKHCWGHDKCIDGK